METKSSKKSPVKVVLLLGTGVIALNIIVYIISAVSNITEELFFTIFRNTTTLIASGVAFGSMIIAFASLIFVNIFCMSGLAT